MKPNQLATLVLRLLGVYCVVQAVPMLGMFSSMIMIAGNTPGSSIGRGFAASLVPGICFLLIGILLLIFSIPLGEKLARQCTGGEKVMTASFEDVQALAFAVAGVLIFAAALPQLFNIFNYLPGMMAASNESRGGQWAFRLRDGALAVGTLLKAVLGLVLFFRARGFANLWRLLRTAGTPKPPQEQ